MTWSTSSGSIALVSNVAGTGGLGTAVGTGTAVITATDPVSGTISGSTNFTVTAATLVSISVDPVNPSKAKGTTQQFTATGTYTDSSTQNITTSVTWSSGDTNVAIISNADGTRGLGTAVNTGTALITATDPVSGTISGSTNFTVTAATLVSISVDPVNPSKAKGTTQQFTATGTYTDSSTQNITTSVTWSSGDINIAEVSNVTGTQGLGTAKNTGTALITATDPGSGTITGSTNFTVTAATLVSIEVTPTNPSMAKGLTQQFTATGTYTDLSTQNITASVTWSSGSGSIATVSNVAGTKGLGTAVNTGTALITATDPVSGTIAGSTNFTVTAATLVSISVSPVNPNLPVSRTLQFTAIGTYTDSATQDITASVTWSSGDITRAEISNAAGSHGIASSLAAGTTTITATSGPVSGNTLLTVTSATLASITITPVNASLAMGFTRQFSAVGIYSDSSTQDITASVTWNSTATGVATISNAAGSNGIASPQGTGTTTISASLGGIPSNSTTLTVTSATLLGISVSPASATIANGTTRQFSATGTYSDNSSQDLTNLVTWASSDTGVATISNAAGSRGFSASVGTGSTNITAVLSGKTGAATLTVTAATLSSISVTPTGAVTIGFGTYQQFGAQGTYSDGSTQDITGLVTWKSSNTDVADISNLSPSNGRAVSISMGYTDITAELSGRTSNTATLEVRILALVGITVTPADPDVVKSGAQQFLATGLYNDGTQQDLTTQVTWTSTDGAVAVISNVPGSQGVATAVGTNGQTSTIQAERSGITGSTVMTVMSDVEAPTVLSAALLPGNRVRVTFSEPVKVAQAQLTTAYRIAVSPSGLCSDNSNFTGNSSVIGISSVSVVSGSIYDLNLASGTSATTYTVLVDKTVLQDLADNNLTCSNSANFTGADTIAPVVTSAVSANGNTVRVTFSEPVNSGQATNASNYKIVNSPASGSCGGGDNFSTSTQTADFTVSSVTGSGAVYDLHLSATQQTGVLYTVIVNNGSVYDTAVTPNALGCPNNADFTGLEQIKVSSALCTDTTHIIVTYSKNILTGLNAAGSAECTTQAECDNRYFLSGGTSLGSVIDARVLNGTVCGGAPADSSKVCLTHQNGQGGGQYTVIVANNVNGDGFDNTSWGSIRDSGNSENIQTSPNDRRVFNGCASAPVTIDEGPISSDPFSDGGGAMGGTDFAYIFSYGGLIYMGPNANDNSGVRMNPDGTNPQTYTFGIHQDPAPDGGGTAVNTIYGNPPVQLFPSFGKTGCTANTAACGPNNQNGRGLFTSGTIGVTEYLFAGSGYTPGNLSTIYLSNEADAALEFPFLNTGPIVGGPGAKGFSTMYVYSSALYFCLPSNSTNRPKFGRITALGTLGGTLPARRGYNAPTGTGMENAALPKLGGNFQCSTFTNNKNVAIETFVEFNGFLYLMGGGCPAAGRDGGIIRYNNGTFTTTTNYIDATPSAAAWAGTSRYSIYLNMVADFTPADKAFPQAAVFQNKLFVARNVCEGFTPATGVATGGTACPAANRRTQLWKCTPGANLTCEPGEWTLVADNGSGNSTMGASGNTSITMLVTNGGYLYVGFEKADQSAPRGIQVWRTSAADPSAAGDFSQVSTTGLAPVDDFTNISIFDSKSFNFSGTNYLYMTVGKAGGIVKVFRQQNN